MKLEAKVGDATHEIELVEEDGRLRVAIDGRAYDAEVLRPEPGTFTFFVGPRVIEARVERVDGSDAVRVRVGDGAAEVLVVDRKRRAAGADGGGEGRQTLAAPMPGRVVAVLAPAGTAVERGQGVLVVEAMKMQNEVKSPKTGTVEKLSAKEGQAVNAGDVLAWID
jgi:biotin carboxyl carrier protein